MIRILKYLLAGITFLGVAFGGLVYSINYYPHDIESVEVSGVGGVPLSKKKDIKVLSWNVQYMAGKNYVFYYDLPDWSGPDSSPSLEDMQITMQGVADIIRDENPDVILLQEVDIDSKHTHYVNELRELQALLPEAYAYTVFTYYHRSSFVPHPNIMGKVGLGLCIFSKYPISHAERYALPQMRMDPLSRSFFLKRCVLQCHLPYAEGGELVVLNTHPEAFTQGSDIMGQQMTFISGLLDDLDRKHTPWIMGGDFNLLPPGQKALLSPQTVSLGDYNSNSELALLTEHWSSVPSVAEATGPNLDAWFTHFPNNPVVGHPDRTLDYCFFSQQFQLGSHLVRRAGALSLSDHLPVISTLSLNSGSGE
ncbi:MAG: endonuclease/exonuclease/phosphatase family protein [Opitutales bacterium]|nr:endonuclease/exonuclease/phosphatase family protein [Opitutales bacterium]